MVSISRFQLEKIHRYSDHRRLLEIRPKRYEAGSLNYNACVHHDSGVWHATLIATDWDFAVKDIVHDAYESREAAEESLGDPQRLGGRFVACIYEEFELRELFLDDCFQWEDWSAYITFIAALDFEHVRTLRDEDVSGLCGFLQRAAYARIDKVILSGTSLSTSGRREVYDRIPWSTALAPDDRNFV